MSEKTPKSALANREEEILAFWNDNRIFQKSLDKESPKGNFVFYDGPPFATGLPHYGHILASAIKDAVPRYKTMQGYHVERKWGWDCHGLPIENIVEKDLKVSGKKEIEALGIKEFNEHARSKVLGYVHEWKRTVDRIARWVDFDGSYKTMDNTYMESVWHALKKIHSEGLIYESTKVLPYCPRCETPIANSEIAMDNSYKDITDISVYVKFELEDELGTFVLAWTTTPWTLPGNVALAVNKDLTYVKAKKDGAFYIVAKDLAEKVLKEGYEIVEEFSGKKLIGKSYLPVFDYYKDKQMPNKDNIWKIWHADFVTLEKGTGVAHEAPVFGEDDMILAKANKLPLIRHVDATGRFTAEVTDFTGIKVKPKDDHQSGDVLIIKYLAKTGALFAKEKIIHSYPHCFRCETPLYYYAMPAWFIEIQKAKKRLLKLNQNIDWIPEHLRDGRFAKSMEGAPDWNISRNRFWATPLPFWKCEHCGKVEVLGSLDDLRQKTKRNSYLLMRHGESEKNLTWTISSTPDAPDSLTERGKRGTLEAAKKLKKEKIDLLFVSDFIRAKETADIVAEQLGLTKEQVIVDHRIGEIQARDFDGMNWEEFNNKFSGVNVRFEEHIDASENYADVRKRVMEFLHDVDSKYEDKNILIIAHGLSLEMMNFAGEGHRNDDLEQWRAKTKWMFDNGEVRKFNFARIPLNSNFELDMHRPYIDSFTWDCSCGGSYKRAPEVIDCWFESGSMPFAQRHAPFENDEWFKKNFPAQFVTEYIAQTRTWFYYMHVVSTLLFDKAPFQNVVTTGTVLAEDGQKMSKRLNNYPDPWHVFDKYSVDALRYYLLSSPLMKSEDLFFSEKGVDDVNKKILLRLNNVVSFYEMYRNNLRPTTNNSQERKNVLDRWIIARLNQLTQEITEAMDGYELDKATRPIADFVDDLSTWYLRRSRDRFKGDDEKDRQAALSTTRFVLQELSKLIAPFMPFVAEDIYLKTKDDGSKESVHLESWPFPNEALEADEAITLLKQMAEVRKIVSLGLEARMKAAIKVRQPLASLKIYKEFSKELSDLIKDEVNVKEILVATADEDTVELDINMTQELKEEGQMRELLRSIQELRKESGLNIEDRAELIVDTDNQGVALIKKFEKEISRPAGLTAITFHKNEGTEIKIDELCLTISIKQTHS